MNEYDQNNMLFESDGIPLERPVVSESQRPTLDEVMSRIYTSLTPDSQVDPTVLAKNIFDLRDPDEKIAQEAQSHLVEIGEAAVPSLVHCFGLTNPPGLSEWVWSKGDEYAKVIEQIGFPATDELIQATEPSNEFIVRLRATNALGRIKEADITKVMPCLLSVIENTANKDGNVNYHSSQGMLIREAANVLKDLKTTDPACHPRVVSLLSHHDWLVREGAYEAVSAHLSADTAVPVLLKCFSDEEARKREDYDLTTIELQGNIISALAHYGKQDARVTPFLIDIALHHPYNLSNVRQALIPKYCDANSVVPTMIEELQKQDGVKLAALYILENYGAAASEAIPLVIKEIEADDSPPGSRIPAVEALASISADLTGPLKTKAAEILRPYANNFYYGGWYDLMKKFGLGPYAGW